jgi:hypothetical protein
MIVLSCGHWLYFSTHFDPRFWGERSNTVVIDLFMEMMSRK